MTNSQERFPGTIRFPLLGKPYEYFLVFKYY